MSKRVLLGHLHSNGDCLFATVIARQIKEIDYPKCHLTWAVSSKCRQSVELNPYVDEIWEIPTGKNIVSDPELAAFFAEVKKRKARGDFDHVFLTQIFGDNYLNYDGGIRSSTYNNYPHEITVPYQPIIHLSEAEVENVRHFVDAHHLEKYDQVILVECSAESFSTALDPVSAFELATEFVANNEKIAFILSSNKKIGSSSPNIFDGSVLTFRENAELTKYCDLFIGCASGISWITTTNWGKDLNKILLINQDQPPFPSMIYDHEYLNLPTAHIIEIKSSAQAIAKLKDCLNTVLDRGFADARERFNEKLVLKDYSFLVIQIRDALARFEFGTLVSCLKRAIRRNGSSLVFSGSPFVVAGHLVRAAFYKILGIGSDKMSRLH